MTISKAEQTDTPFNIAFDEDCEKWLIALGNQIISKKQFNNQEEAINYINQKPWDIILTTCAVIYNNIKQQTENK